MSFQTRKTFVIFGTQIKIFLMKSERFLTLHRQQQNFMKLREYFCLQRIQK